MGKTIKEHGTQQAARAIIRLLPKISDENLIRLTYLAEWLSSDSEVLNGIRKVRKLLQTPGHPAKHSSIGCLSICPRKGVSGCLRLFSMAPGLKVGSCETNGKKNWAFVLLLS